MEREWLAKLKTEQLLEMNLDNIFMWLLEVWKLFKQKNIERNHKGRDQ